MIPESRFIFDTNVIISALLFQGSAPGRAFFFALQSGVMLLSESTFTELSEVLSRPKFDPYLTSIEREQFLTRFLLQAELVEVTQRIQVCRDPKDDRLLELAIAGRAGCIISGDEDLLVLNPFRGIPVLTPQEFLRSRISETSQPP